MEENLNTPKKMPPRPMPPPKPPRKPVVEPKEEVLEENTNQNQEVALTQNNPEDKLNTKQFEVEESQPTDAENSVVEDSVAESTVKPEEQIEEQPNVAQEINNTEPQEVKENSTNKSKKQPKTPKKQKEPKVKKPLSKTALIILSVIATVVLALIVVIAGLMLKNIAYNRKLSAPSLTVEQLYNGTVLEVSKIDGAVSYEFEIKKLSDNTISTIKSSSNILELNSYLNQVGEYSVKVRALGRGSGATSDYSETVEFDNYKQLSKPQIFINNLDKQNNTLYKTNSQTNDDTISWNSVANASKYIVRYGVNLSNGTIASMEQAQKQGEVVFDLSKIYKNGPGSYQISVIAVPENNSYYLQSDYEQIITVEYYASMDNVSVAKYNKTTKALSFELLVGSNYGNEFSLSIISQSGTTEHKIYLDKCNVTENNSMVVVTTSLEQIELPENFEMKLTTIGDGRFSTNSEPASVIII